MENFGKVMEMIRNVIIIGVIFGTLGFLIGKRFGYIQGLNKCEEIINTVRLNNNE